jgi:gas vesicle protein
MRDDNGYNALGWLVLGGLAGACAALLLAPASGRKTRERLTRRLRDTRDSVTDLADEFVDTSREIAEKAGRVGGKAVRLAEDASAAARDVVTSVGGRMERLANR